MTDDFIKYYYSRIGRLEVIRCKILLDTPIMYFPDKMWNLLNHVTYHIWEIFDNEKKQKEKLMAKKNRQ